MTKRIGRDEVLWMRLESPRLSGMTSGGVHIRWTDLNIDNDFTHFQQNAAFGRVEGTTGSRVGRHKSNTSVTFPIYNEYLQYLIFGIVGASGTVNTGVGVTSGIAVPVENTSMPVTFTLGVSGRDYGWVSSGNIMQTASITANMQTDDFVTATMTFEGTPFVSGAVPATVLPADDIPFIPADVLFSINSGVAPADLNRRVRQVTFDVNRNATVDHELGNKNPVNAYSRTFEFSVTAEMLWDSADATSAQSGFYQLYNQSGTPIVGRIRMNHSERALSGIVTPTGTFEFRGNVTDYSKARTLDDLTMQTVSVTGSRRLATGLSFTGSYIQSGNYA
jgi:hypothetical protein